MARKFRIQNSGVLYQVMSRGNQGQTIILSDRDRTLFSETFGEGCEKPGWATNAYVLMGNESGFIRDSERKNDRQ